MLDPDGGLLRGTLDVLILKALSWGPRHGYAVADWIQMVTDGELLVEEGPLYTALHRLEKQRWLTAEWGYSENNRRAKYYTLSRSGRAQLKTELSAWDRYARAVGKALIATAPRLA
jgi:transcriptional regulator